MRGLGLCMGKRKVCKRCLKKKEVTQFYRHEKMGDGRLSFCKECTKTRIRNARLDPRLGDKIRLYDRQRSRTAKRKKMAADARRKWRKNDPRKALAERQYGNARTTKKLMPLPCWVCGSEVKLHGHHFDYDKPLEVIWLCHDHHVDMHRQIRDLKIDL